MKPRNINWKEVNRDMAIQFKEDCRNYGWLNLLRELSSLDKTIRSFRPGQGSTDRDYCPQHGGESGTSFRLLKSAEEDGAGYCFSCAEMFDGFKIIMLSNGTDFKETVQLIKDVIYPGGVQPFPWENIEGGLSNYVEGHYAHQKPTPIISKPVELTDEEKKRATWRRKENNRLLDESVSINHASAKPLRDYFLSRSIDTWGDFGDSLRFHPAVLFTEKVLCVTDNGKEKGTFEERLAEREAKLSFLRNHPFYRSEKRDGRTGTIFCDMGLHPAALFLMSDNNTLKPTGIQRVYLSDKGTKMELNGFFDINIKRKTPAIPGICPRGSSCHIDSPVNRILGAAEGPETTLAVRSSIGMPMNCTIDASGLGNYIPNEATDCVVIFADKDKSGAGLKAAKKLQKRLQEEFVEAIIVEPPLDIPAGAKSVDWNDAVQILGKSAFPEWLINWNELDV